MLFFNFLCLFYLMVPINSHTISKSIVKGDGIINVVDSIHDLENDKEHDIKQNRFHIRNGFHKDPNIRNEWTTSKYAKLDTSTLPTAYVNLTRDVTDKCNQLLVTKTHKKGLFRRIIDKMKGKKNKQLIKSNMMSPIRITTTITRDQKCQLAKNKTTRKGNVKNYLQLKQQRKMRRKRKLKRRKSVLRIEKDDGVIKNNDGTRAHSKKSKRHGLPEFYNWKSDFPFTSDSSHSTDKKNSELNLIEMRTKLNNVKEIDGVVPNGYTILMSIMANPSFNPSLNKYVSSDLGTTVAQTNEFIKDIFESPEIEEMLNKIKLTTFESASRNTENDIGIAEMSDPSTKKGKSIFKTILKRNAASNRNISSYGHVEHEQLKKVYAKVKNQLSKEFKESARVIKSDPVHWVGKLKSSTNIDKTENKNKARSYNLFCNSQNFRNSASIGYIKTTQPATDDDYAMISKYEMLLDNIYPEQPSIDATTRAYYNSDAYKTNLMRNEKVLYKLQSKDSEVEVGDYDAVAPSYAYEEYDNNVQNENPSDNIDTNTQSNERMTTVLKDLAQKLCYNDYVNGYKHYLKFQKEQGVQNYSNLVRYQAHRHHSVDDIGKFILNKLPTVPNRHKRAFYDASETTEDQDISTKNEESWFKKHFYLFIDSGQPKKYHTSQTISLRPLVTERNDTAPFKNENSIKSTFPKQSDYADLDELANILKMMNRHTTAKKPSKHDIDPAGEEYRNIERLFNTRLNDKKEKNDDKENDMTTELNVDLLLESILKRPKRTAKNGKNTDNEYQLYNSYVPQIESDSLREFPTEPTSPQLNIKNYEKYGYVDSAVTHPTAVVRLRSAGHESMLRKLFNRFRVHFHKKKNRQMVSSMLQKRDSPRTIKSINPLKKLKKMLNARIDGKPDMVLSKMFDYDVLNSHVNQFTHNNYDKLPPNLEDLNIDIPTVIPEASKISNFTKDLQFSISVPKKYFQHNNDDPVKTEGSDGTETLLTESNQFLMTRRISAPSTLVELKPVTDDPKNNPDFTESDLINIKVTTVRTYNEYTTQNMCDLGQSSRNFVEKSKQKCRNTLGTSNNGAGGKLEDIYLSSLDSENQIVSNHEQNADNMLKNVRKLIPSTHFQSFSNNQMINESRSIKTLANYSITKKNIPQVGEAHKTSNRTTAPGLKTKQVGLNTTKGRRFSSSISKFKTTPNYFDDFEMWHNDILHSEKYTTWQNILKNIQQPYQYKPPDVTFLKNELSRLDNLMDGTKSVSEGKLKNVSKKNEIVNNRSQATNDAPTKVNRFVKRSRKKKFNIYLDNNDERHINRPYRHVKTFNIPGVKTTQHRKMLHPNHATHKDQVKELKASRTNQGSTSEKDVGTDAEMTLLLDATLLAYDDSSNVITDVLEERTSKSSRTSSYPINILTKLHKVPDQYFSTPLPMINEDFNKFLMDNNIDVQSVTAPIVFPKHETLKPHEKQHKGPILTDLHDRNNQIKKKLHPQKTKKTSQNIKASEHTSPKNKIELTKKDSKLVPITKLSESRLKPTATETTRTSLSPSAQNGLGSNYKSDERRRAMLNVRKVSYGDSYDPAKNNGDYLEYGPQIPKESYKNNSDYYLDSNPKTVELSKNTIKYDVMFDPVSSGNTVNKINGDPEASTSSLKEYGNCIFPSTKELTNDHTVADREPGRNRRFKRRQQVLDQTRDEQIKELVRVVEAVENFTRPNVLLHVELPVYYLPDTKRNDLPPIRSPPKSIWNDFILKYVSGIALLELLTKFGILKTVEPSLTDGMGEDSNTCGLFSGAGETQSALDLRSGARIRRNQKPDEESTSSTKQSKSPEESTLAPKHGNIVYDLKQFGRTQNQAPFAAKLRRGSYRKASSVFAKLRDQIEVAFNQSTGATISKTPSVETDSTIATATVKETRSINMTTMKTSRMSRITEALKPLKKVSLRQSVEMSTTPMKHLNKDGTSIVRSTQEVAKRNLTSKASYGTPTKPSSKHTSNPNAGVRRLVIITTKIFLKNLQNKTYNDGTVNTKLPLPTIPSNIISHLANITVGTGAKMSQAKNKSSPALNSTFVTHKVLNISTSSTSKRSTTDSDTTPCTAETNFMDLDNDLDVTGNYYDYQTADIDYKETESKFETTDKPNENSTVKHDKRDLRSQNTFTAKDVAAIEVIVDLLRKNRNSNSNVAHTLNDLTKQSTTSGLSIKPPKVLSRPRNICSNSIQVHIAIPCNLTLDKKRSLNNPIRIRKVFTAKLCTPVDMEYQIHSVEDIESPSTVASTVLSSHKTNRAANIGNVRQSTVTTKSYTLLNPDKLSPGLYVLVENNTLPNGQYILKPVYNNQVLPDYEISQAIPETIITPEVPTSTQPSDLAKVTLSKDFIAIINKHLTELYQYLITSTEHNMKERKDKSDTAKSKRSASFSHRRRKKQINWDTIKKYFSHDRVCHCRCKANRTMCRACAATDAVVSELIFELDNLAKYMNDHCTEIQTYFWMNPSGGRKLRFAVHRIDKTLSDYYKRVKGKCQGRPCKEFTYIDKRDFVNPDKKSNYIGDPLIHDVETVADHLEQAFKFNIGDENLVDTGTKCLDIITKCMHLKSFNKRENEVENRRIKNVYSLDNVNVNIICKSDKLDSTPQNFYDITTLSTSYVTGSPNFYYDGVEEYTKEENKKKGFKSLLSIKGYGKKKRKDKNNLFPYDITSTDGDTIKISLRKRHIKDNYKIETSTGDKIELRWLNLLNDQENDGNSVEETTIRDRIYESLNNNSTINYSKNTSTANNSTKYDYSSYDEEGKDNRYYNVAAYTVYKKIIANFASQSDKEGVNLIPTQPHTRDLKDSEILLTTNDLASLKKTKQPVLNVTYIQNNTKSRVTVTPVILKSQKAHSSTKARNITNYTKNVTSSTTQETLKNRANSRNNTKQNVFGRFKDATLSFFNLVGNNSKIFNAVKTTPIAGFKSSTVSNKREIRSSFNKGTKSSRMTNKEGDIASTSTILPKTPKRNVVGILTKKPLDDELVFENYAKKSVTKNNKELLLSILDFETNKLNDEWQRIALKKTQEDYEEEDDPSIFQLHSELVMLTTENTKGHQKEKITALNICHETVSATNEYKHKSVGNKKFSFGHKSIPQTVIRSKMKETTQEPFYDIRQDLPPIQFPTPPGLITQKEYHGFLDKFMDKFKFKVLPHENGEKVAKSHSNGPKGRSLSSRYELGKRLHNKTANSANATTVNMKRTRKSRTTPYAKTTISSTLGMSANDITKANGFKAVSVSEQLSNIDRCSENNDNGEVCEPFALGMQCDIEATTIYIRDVYKTKTPSDFKKFVKNITCHKYKKPPSIFKIKDTIKIKKRRQHSRSNIYNKLWQWNWVRDRRSLESIDSTAEFTNKNEMDYDYIDDDNINRNDDLETKESLGKLQYVLRNDKEDYDRLYLGADGVYRGRENERKKRKTIDMTNVVSGLTNLPPLRELVDEIFVIRGNSVTLHCNDSGSPIYSTSNITNMYRYTWTGERKSMLSASNIKVLGPSLVLKAIQPKNYGTYTCSQDKIVTRSIRVNVIEIPDFNIVFTPLYKCLGECTYVDLKNIQKLGTVLMKSSKCYKDSSCVIRIDQPVSLSNKVNENQDLLRPTVVITAIPPPSIKCDPECRRDLTCSLALLWASNVPALAAVKVVIMYEKFNNTLTPVDGNSTMMTITKKLRSKDTNGHHEYQTLSRHMSPGDVDVVVACPAGYYLLASQKICAACPANTCAAAGENACTACPRGTHAEPGAVACRLGLGRRLHRYDDKGCQSQWCSWLGYAWQWYVVVCGVACVCCACVAGGVSARHRGAVSATSPTCRAPERWACHTGQRRARRPLSPSRVILERLYKRSQTSSRATDSQDTKFVLMEEMIGPPPLPPIDFE